MLLSLLGCAAPPSRVPVTVLPGLVAPIPLGLDAIITVPEKNPLTPEKAHLGARLFTDPILSLDRSRSCASCHRLDVAFADSARVSSGVHARRATRNAPTLFNRAYGKSFFWDG